MVALADTTHANGERTPAQNRRVTIHDNDSENMLVEAVTLRFGGTERVVFSGYRSARDVDPEARFVLSQEEAAALHADLGRYLSRRGLNASFEVAA